MNSDIILRVTDLTLSYATRKGIVKAVHGAGFSIRRGERVALVGESGSGKSTIASTIIGLEPRNLIVEQGDIRFADANLLTLRERELNKLRGSAIGYVPQDPTVSLDPLRRIGEQVAEALTAHGKLDSMARDERVRTVLQEAGIDNPELRCRQYPHELSGGLKQRVLIAIAMVNTPSLLIADEPTSGLDVTVQKTILDNLDAQVERHGLSELLITHDLGVAADRTDRILVMQHGSIVEEGKTKDIIQNPQHPYTKQLIANAPGLNAIRRIHSVGSSKRSGASPDNIEALSLRNIAKVFRARSRKDRDVVALDNVSLSVNKGETMGLVGESGSGKTTLGRIALRLESADSGIVRLNGQDISDVRGEHLRQLRKQIQVVQQNPYASLNPKMTIGHLISEPVGAFQRLGRRERRQVAAEMLDAVKLPTNLLERYPNELSGGQRQRVAIARALSIRPSVLVLDEPVSALDVTAQSQILDLLVDLQRNRKVGYLFISHDLAVVRDIAHSITVIDHGRIQEQGDTESVFNNPATEYTRKLLDSIPGTAFFA
ncbi:ABC transporter ATP-binding protein [Bifidobacterium sp. UTBIF-78]|uniref:dipeptide ABC transporter ATP-binding protein n=1 Tax=Bifidobacterium sp. UTBIF-78 TaxID=1465263 RepID=UPI00112DA4A3|nr:ABC transporter ATP-binding protein [Bifidobacterium sp. UTBIF-78]TPF91878.1 hypothetical protein BG22_10335 [Bifidobacterium sp. UTBIF-78]